MFRAVLLDDTILKYNVVWSLILLLDMENNDRSRVWREKNEDVLVCSIHLVCDGTFSTEYQHCKALPRYSATTRLWPGYAKNWLYQCEQIADEMASWSLHHGLDSITCSMAALWVGPCSAAATRKISVDCAVIDGGMTPINSGNHWQPHRYSRFHNVGNR